MSMEYREYILDHYRNPRNYGTLEEPTVHSEDANPLCGDQLAMDLLVESDHVAEVYNLPAIHQDPFDRVLIAQAIVEDLTLVTTDEVIREYAGERLRVVH